MGIYIITVCVFMCMCVYLWVGVGGGGGLRKEVIMAKVYVDCGQIDIQHNF